MPDLTLYGDGTLIYQSGSGDGTRLLETTLPEDAVRELLEDIVDEGFLDFLYEQPAPEGASGPTTFFYGQTRDRANAVSIRGANDLLPEDAGDEFDQYRKVQDFVETLRSLDPVALGGTKSVAYLPESYLTVSTERSEGDVTERVLLGEEADELLQSLGGIADLSLEQLRGPLTLMPDALPSQEVGIAPLLPFYQNFPEFDLQ